MQKQNSRRNSRSHSLGAQPSRFGIRLMMVGLAALTAIATSPVGRTAEAKPLRAAESKPKQAAELTGCFMVDASGKTVSLGTLCGYAAPEPTSAGASGGKASGAAAGQNSRVVQVPIVRRSGRTPVIAVTFNGQKTYEMILDTGASGTLVTSRMAAELKLQPSGFVQAEIADGSMVQFATGRVKSIAVKNARVDNVEVAIAADTDIGLLGHDFFGDFDIRIGETTVEFIRR